MIYVIGGIQCKLEDQITDIRKHFHKNNYYGRKRPWLDSAAYLSIIYIEYSKINPENIYRVKVSGIQGFHCITQDSNITTWL